MKRGCESGHWRIEKGKVIVTHYHKWFLYHENDIWCYCGYCGRKRMKKNIKTSIVKYCEMGKI